MKGAEPKRKDTKGSFLVGVGLEYLECLRSFGRGLGRYGRQIFTVSVEL